MKHIKTFEKYQNKKRRDDIIRESVLQVNDIYKVRTMIDIPQSLINSYVKKVKDTTGKNLRQFFGDVDLAEEIVKFINLEFTNVDKLPAGFLTGDAQAQGQGQTQVQPEGQVQAQPEDQGQVQVQADAQGQNQGDEFEEVQGQSQGQSQSQGQAQSEEESEEEGSEELPEEGEENEEF